MYTESELALNREAGENKARLLSALWITGRGPKGGKVNIGQPRYDALNLLVIENKATVVSRFVGHPLYATLQVYGIVIRFPKLRAVEKKTLRHWPKNPGEDQRPPWE